MSSAICFNLDQSKILLSGNGLIIFTENQALTAEYWHHFAMLFFDLDLFNSLPNDKILDVTKLKAFADDKCSLNDDFSF